MSLRLGTALLRPKKASATAAVDPGFSQLRGQGLKACFASSPWFYLDLWSRARTGQTEQPDALLLSCTLYHILHTHKTSYVISFIVFILKYDVFPMCQVPNKMIWLELSNPGSKKKPKKTPKNGQKTPPTYYSENISERNGHMLTSYWVLGPNLQRRILTQASWKLNNYGKIKDLIKTLDPVWPLWCSVPAVQGFLPALSRMQLHIYLLNLIKHV